MLSSFGVFWRPGATHRDKWYAVASIVGTIYFMSLTTFVTYLSLFEILPVVFVANRDAVFYHSVCIIYLFVNIIGNFTNAHAVDTSLGALPEELLRAGRRRWPKWCGRCRQRVPRRCHHCVICDKCVMKRDHHCFFIGTCVGYANQKYFVLFCLYTFVAGLYSTVLQALFLQERYQVAFQGLSTLITLIPSTCWHWAHVGDVSGSQAALVLVFYGSFCSGLLSGSFFFWQLYIIYRGQTQWEARMGIDCYSRTWSENFIDTFGTGWLLSLLLPWPRPQADYGLYQDQYRDEDSSGDESSGTPPSELTSHKNGSTLGLPRNSSFGGFPKSGSPLPHRNASAALSFKEIYRDGSGKLVDARLTRSLNATPNASPSPTTRRTAKSPKKVNRAKLS